ncbi:putative antirepressor protein Ant [Escherichia coli PA7]|uniref:phage antirepressor N-terminal domain-containing protein n=1 Tax=Escherichia coli TaxID=562 RepID=UPI00028BF7B1|nr:phage antirepressor N-terminal domain-containing protein [Escherichia coli]EKH02072.1 putative antirepressor protein Ant [Escherichia coli PA7]
MNMMAVPFHGNSLYVVNHNGVTIRSHETCRCGMGLAWQSQLAKLRQRFASTITEIVMVAEDGKQRNMVSMPLRKLAGWLQTINPNKVKPEIRDKVIRYQEECDDVLYEYWTKGFVVNPRKMSVMEELNQACADMKRDKNIASVFATGLNEWKQVKAAHVSKIRTLVNEANMLIDFVLADTGKGKITKAD